MSREPLTPRQGRWSSKIRGLVIAVLITCYGFMLGDPGASFEWALLVGVGLQAAVLLARRFLSAETLPQALDILELLADGATVFLFALGVLGGRLSYGLGI